MKFLNFLFAFVLLAISCGVIALASDTPSFFFDDAVSSTSTFNSTYNLWSYNQTRASGWNNTGFSLYPNNLTANVGIGITSPAYKLDVLDTTAGAVAGTLYPVANFKITSGISANRGLQIGIVDYATGIQATNGGVLSGTWLSLQPGGGNVGIGMTGPQNTLQVNGVIKAASSDTAGVVGVGDSSAATTYAGIFRSTSAGALGGGNVLGLGGYDGIAFTAGADVLGSQGTPKMFIKTDGNVGIGTVTPFEQLTNTNGNIMDASAVGTTGGSSLSWNVNSAGYAVAFNQSLSATNAQGLLIRVAGITTNKILTLDSGGVDRLTVLGSGNVGIGTAAPTQKLEVAGNLNITSGGNLTIGKGGIYWNGSSTIIY